MTGRSEHIEPRAEAIDEPSRAGREKGHRWGHFALPSLCELCRRWGDAWLCSACLAQHARLLPRCGRCGLALGAPQSACGQCLREPPAHGATVCALEYGFPWDRLITQFKFHRHAELASPLAECLGAAVARAPQALAERPLVVPVPLSRKRLAERGFNQSWELARRVAHRFGLKACPDALQRVLDTPPQAALSRAERQRNLRNAFAPAPHAPLRGAAVALVDDVMTTGATAHEAAAALLRGGAHSVQLWVLARTPAPLAAG